MRWGLKAAGADDLADRLANLAELPFLDEALRASLEAARERLGARAEVERLAEEGYGLRLPAEPFGVEEFGTLDWPARPALGPALRDSRGGLSSAVLEGLRAGLARVRRGAA